MPDYVKQPQMSTGQVLRPPRDFQPRYEGVNANTNPLYFTLGGVELDDLVGDPGYDPLLIRGLPVPMGSRVVLWLPNLTAILPGPTADNYEWSIIWRLRSPNDYRNNAEERPPYHFPQKAGAQDTVANEPRVAIPAAFESVNYVQTEPGTVTGRATTNVRALDLTSSAIKVAGPLLPAAARGVVQQGITDPTFVPDATEPEFLTYETLAKGDEFLIALRRLNDAPQDVWAFATTDIQVSQLLGTGLPAPNDHPIYDDNGVYVFFGTDP